MRLSKIKLELDTLLPWSPTRSINLFPFLLFSILGFLQVFGHDNLSEVEKTRAWGSGNVFSNLTHNGLLTCTYDYSHSKTLDDLTIKFDIMGKGSSGIKGGISFDYLPYLTKEKRLNDNLKNSMPEGGSFDIKGNEIIQLYFFKGTDLWKVKPSKEDEHIYYAEKFLSLEKEIAEIYLKNQRLIIFDMTGTIHLYNEFAERIQEFRNHESNGVQTIGFHNKQSLCFVNFSNGSNKVFSLEDEIKEVNSFKERIIGFSGENYVVTKSFHLFPLINICPLTQDEPLISHNYGGAFNELGEIIKSYDIDSDHIVLFFEKNNGAIIVDKISGVFVSHFEVSNIVPVEGFSTPPASPNSDGESIQLYSPYLLFRGTLYEIENDIFTSINWYSGMKIPKITFRRNVPSEVNETTKELNLEALITSNSIEGIKNYKVEKKRFTNSVTYLNKNIHNEHVDSILVNVNLELSEGVNHFLIKASDKLFNETKKEFTITRKQKNTRGALPVAANSLEEKVNSLEYKALIISNQEYQEGVDKLAFPHQDAEKLKTILTSNYSFKEKAVFHMKDASRSDIINALDSLANIVDNNDNLLIFYAGHGVFDDNLNKGYWLPIDADSQSKSNWVSNSEIKDYLSAFKSQHTLLISDACFSGSIFEFNKREFSKKNKKVTAKLLEKKSRKAMTSGLNKPVPDESKFIKYLLQELEKNKKSYLTAGQLFLEIREAVIANTNNNPQFEVIKNANHEGGEFVFFKSEEND